MKSQIRLNKVAQRQNKPTYKYLTDTQRKIVKAVERQRQTDKDMSKFYVIATKKYPLHAHGGINFEIMSTDELDCFDRIYKAHERACKALHKFNDCEIDGAMNIFTQTNLHSTSF